LFVFSLSSLLKAEITSDNVSLLQLLNVVPSEESIDYVQNKTQFQLHTLLTEQRHPKTWDFSRQVQLDTLAGLRMLSSVDEDVKVKLEELSSNTQVFEQAILAIDEAIVNDKKIFIYGCGATGRLAKQMESSFWRPFWKSIKDDKKIWKKLKKHVGANIEDRLIGEMTGADRALISSLEGFEDLQLIGRLQVADRGVKKGDVIIAVTEGGETSSVIGAVLGGLQQWKQMPGYAPEISKKSLYFIYNNPDELLLPFERSRQVLNEPGITKINLTTGPQSITGSTRMQATTIETYVVGTMLQAALHEVLKKLLTTAELNRTGFSSSFEIASKFKQFNNILNGVTNALPALSKLTDLEAQTYTSNHFSTYFAEKVLITVFIDSTERSPTFRLFPLDTILETVRRCWIQVWTAADNQKDAWEVMLGRAFRGLSTELYQKPFETEIEDPYLKKAALESLKKAGDDQQNLYDFSFSNFNITHRNLNPSDLAVIVALTPEEEKTSQTGSYFKRFFNLIEDRSSNGGIILVSNLTNNELSVLADKIRYSFKAENNNLVIVPVSCDNTNDPFALNQHIAAKMLLNAHSTAVMGKLGKVVGNTMTNVSPSNLKLIGRATYLILSHVNDVLTQPLWIKTYGRKDPITYMEANAVLYDSIYYLKDKQNEAGQTAEVALSIIRILESLKHNSNISHKEALKIVQDTGLAQYLDTFQ
jgi:N-acetylmuramic acid 6-phosphate (MurNAc-6-P) etherase